MPEYIYRTIEEAPRVPCPCGTSTRIITRADTPVANVHVTTITDSTRHYHKEATEIYYILDGNGEMELGKDTVELRPGVTIMIPPGLAHRAYGDVKCLIVGVPACKHDDEFFGEEQTMKEQVPVVTAFVVRGDKIALIKRSQQVGTYKGSWAAFSGYVETVTLDQAFTELSEEAGLPRESLSLRGIGAPLPVEDAQEGRSWLVLPFLFELKDGAEIRTDWEAEKWDWFHASDLEEMETVPGLTAALDRVMPAFGDAQFWDELADIAADRCSGATKLARKGLAALGGYVQDRSDSIGHDVLLRSIRAFASCRPTMGVFSDLAARLLLAMDREGGQFKFDALVTELLSMVNDAADLSVTNAAEVIEGKNTILTLSYSEAVRDTILAWKHNDCKVLVAESKPGGEGVRLADELHAEGVRVKVVSDSEIPAMAREVDAVLVGCDALTEENLIVNKVGTSAAVSSADEAGVPSYVIAQTYKIIPPGWPFFLEQWEAAGVSGHSDYVRTGTVVFDGTPIGDFTAVITEEGPLSLVRLEEIRTELGSVELMP